jgi:predicted O-methyltransferase YrrM
MVSKFDLIRHFNTLGFKTGAEIGVAQGFVSEFMCKNIPGLKLYCIDAWEWYPHNRWLPKGRAERHYERAKSRLAPYNAILIKKYSMDAIKDIPDNSLDFVFIDANHDFDHVMEDLINWTKKVRKGGIVSGDDYFVFKGAGVIEAVNAYTKAHGITFQLTDPYSINLKDREGFEQPVYYWTKEY